MNTYEKARAFMYRNARPLEIALWQYHFEGGSKEAVLHALSYYQNEDGGFGHALEADNWNPHSSPLTSQTATEILFALDVPAEHPIIQNLLRYLDSGMDFVPETRQWRNTVPSSNGWPRAIWWTYSEDEDEFRYNPTAALAAFILRYADRGSPLYALGHTIAEEAFAWFLGQEVFEDKHAALLLMRLLQYGEGHCIPGLEEVRERMHAQVRRNICTDLDKYGVEYVDRPTDLIDGPDNPWYPDIAQAALAECDFLIASQQEDGSWPVPWQWWNEYTKEYEVAANWWKGHLVLKHILYLRHFGRL